MPTPEAKLNGLMYKLGYDQYQFEIGHGVVTLKLGLASDYGFQDEVTVTWSDEAYQKFLEAE